PEWSLSGIPLLCYIDLKGNTISTSMCLELKNLRDSELTRYLMGLVLNMPLHYYLNIEMTTIISHTTQTLVSEKAYQW
ncbi:hypothetical protein ACWXWU_17650, partial [Shewanella sp. A14]